MRICHWVVILLLGYCVISLGGCVTIKETAKGIAGISTKVLEENRKEAIIKTFNYGHEACYNNVRAILEEKGSYIYAQDPQKLMMAIYVSSQDTTPVGLFFKEIDAVSTRIEISSPSVYAREFIAARLVKGFNPE